MTTDGLRHPIKVRTVLDDQGLAEIDVVSVAKGLPTEGRFRVFLCSGLFAAVFCILGVRLAMVSFGMAKDPHVFEAIEVADSRPSVYDRNGRPLILNRRAKGLAIDGRDVWDINEAVSKITHLFPDVDSVNLRDRLSARRYAMVSDSITPAMEQKVIALGLPGLSFPDTVERAYPQKDLAAHVIGYTIPGHGGATGAERAIDYGHIAAYDGEIRLSIDLIAQQALEDELAAAMLTFSGKAAWGVLLHAKTGEVRALASLPDYNPNLPGAVASRAWRNRAMSDVYELGSAFKPLTIALALENQAIGVTDTFDVSKPIDVGGWVIKDYSTKTFPLTVSEIVQYSSNIGTIKVVKRLGRERFVAGLDALGLSAPMVTELPERRMPILPEKWHDSELASSSYGHGIAVSPLQLTAAFAATINGGIYRVPTFQTGQENQGVQVFSERTSAQMRMILRQAVTDGTGRNAEAAGYYVIGKTATADKPDIGGYRNDGELVSSFIGAFPGYDPEYVLLVSIDEPKGTKKTYGYATSGYVAAPIFKGVVERIAPPLGLMPVADDVAFDGFVGMRREAANTEQRSVLVSPFVDAQGVN